MTVYTFSEARQKFASVLERARHEGAVWVKRRDGQVFLIAPQRSPRSPLDVAGIDLELPTEEVVGIVREMRQRVNLGQPPRVPGRNARKRPAKSVS